MKKILLALFCFMTTNIFSQNTECDKLVNKGFELLKQGNLSLAIDKYNEALKINPKRVEAHYGLGVAYSATCLQNGGYCDIAIKHFIEANKIKPGYRETYFNLGVCYIKSFNYKEALFYLDKAIGQKNNDGEYYYNRGYAKIQLGKVNEGCEDLQKALSLNFTPAEDLIKKHCRNQKI
jgi:tetratricopeptide (TPR) repeat protein